MAKIKITCDSTCDLSATTYQANNVDVIPLTVTLGDKAYHDGVDIHPQQIFDYVAETGILPMTSAISMGEYLDVWTKYREEGYDIIHINLSKELSTSYQNACLAAQELGHVYVVDSQTLSTGGGCLVLEAARMIQEGMEAPAIKERLDALKDHLEVSFVLQKLEYLQKGGRCSSVTALGARALHIRPEIRVHDGGMSVGHKYRGSMEKSVLAYVRGCLEGRTDIDPTRIFVTYSSCSDALLEKVVALIKELQPCQEIIFNLAGCTICSHCGPDCLGLILLTK